MEAEHPYVTSLRHFLTAYGTLAFVITVLFISGYIQGAFSWYHSTDVATNMEYQGPAYTGHKK